MVIYWIDRLKKRKKTRMMPIFLSKVTLYVLVPFTETRSIRRREGFGESVDFILNMLSLRCLWSSRNVEYIEGVSRPKTLQKYQDCKCGSGGYDHTGGNFKPKGFTH